MVAWLSWFGCPGSEPKMPPQPQEPEPQEGGAPLTPEISYALHIEDDLLSLSLDAPCTAEELRLRARDEALLSVPLRARAQVAREDGSLAVRCVRGEVVHLEYVLPAEPWPLWLDGRSLFLLPEPSSGPARLEVRSPRGEVYTAVQGSRIDTVSLFSAKDARDLLSGPLIAGQDFAAPRRLGELPIEVLFSGSPSETDLDSLASDLERALGEVSALWGPLEEMRVFWSFGAPSPALLSRRVIALSGQGERREMLREALSALARAQVARCHPFLDGVASYYDVLLSARLGLLSEEELLSELSAFAREARSGGDPSRAVAWLLDAAIRRESADRSSLDALAVGLCTDPEGALVAAGYPEIAETVGASLLDGKRLDYGGALQWFGLGWRDDLTLEPDPGASPIAARRSQRWRAR